MSVYLRLLVDLLVFLNTTIFQIDIESGGEGDNRLAHAVALRQGFQPRSLLHFAGFDLCAHVLVLANELADDELDSLLLGAIAALGESLAHR